MNISIKTMYKFKILFFIAFLLHAFSCQNNNSKQEIEDKKERKMYDDLIVEFANVNLPYCYPDSMFFKYFDEAIEEDLNCKLYDSASTAFLIIFENVKNKTNVIIGAINKKTYKYYEDVKGVFVYKNHDFYIKGDIDESIVYFNDSIVNREYFEHNYRPSIDRSTWYYDVDYRNKELILTGQYICYENREKNESN